MEDDLFQSLGGSLMKDLLADLQGDEGEGDGWLSLEQLEKELSQLGMDEGAAPAAAAASTLGSLPLPPVPSAASMVVTGQQQFLQHQQQLPGQPPQQQQAVHGVGLLGDVTVTTAPVDAWKESLQKFTALSLGQDFLAADSVRKQQQATVPAPPQLPPGFMAEAEDYDATEKATFKPPPGMITSANAADNEDKEREEQARLAAAALLPGAAAPPLPAKKGMPKTPANSEMVSAAAPSGDSKKRTPKTPRNSVIIKSAEDAEKVKAKASGAKGGASAGIDDDVPMMGKVTLLKKEGDATEKPKLPTKTPRNSVVVPGQESAAAVAAGRPPQGMPMQPQGGMMPPHGMPMPPQGGMIAPHMMQGMPQGMPMGMPMPPHGMPMPPMQGMPPHHMMMGHPPQGGRGGGPVPMGMPAQGGPAWQNGPRPPPRPPPMRVFCNPHPNAPPIPAQVLESRYMKSRDITYIVHSMMKPVLMAGISERDYDIQVLYRQSGVRPAGPRPGPRGGRKDKKNDDPTLDVMEREMVSREKKTKEWAAKNAALGHLPKSNVARPRALIATPFIAQSNQDSSESASEQKQRARLWKARIYCDQAYQAYLVVVDIWAKATPGSVPPQVHAPLIRLMKCLGITGGSAPSADNAGGSDYKVDAQVLQLFLKLSKGRTLFARIVEQALLPPSAIQAVLAATLDILYKNPPLGVNNQGGGADDGDATDDRCFRALTGVVHNLPSLSGDSVLQSAEMMKANSEAALSSTSRMECLHALLQRGNELANSPDDALKDYKAQWKETESSFLNILSGM